MITRYGYDVFFTVTALCFLAVVLALVFIEPKAVRIGVVCAAVVLFGLTLNFFRDPDRVTPAGERFIIAPADGTIIAIRPVQENEFLRSDAVLVSIFMSPLNVHVNRSPVTGVVRYTRYVRGDDFAAYEDKASEKNEQMIVGMESTHGNVLFKQIAGFIARRIVCTLTPGDSVKAGTRFGMIKFGSRVDVVVPTTAVVKAALGERTVAGETILAEFAR